MIDKLDSEFIFFSSITFKKKLLNCENIVLIFSSV